MTLNTNRRSSRSLTQTGFRLAQGWRIYGKMVSRCNRLNDRRFRDLCFEYLLLFLMLLRILRLSFLRLLLNFPGRLLQGRRR